MLCNGYKQIYYGVYCRDRQYKDRLIVKCWYISFVLCMHTHADVKLTCALIDMSSELTVHKTSPRHYGDSAVEARACNSEQPVRIDKTGLGRQLPRIINGYKCIFEHGDHFLKTFRRHFLETAYQTLVSEWPELDTTSRLHRRLIYNGNLCDDIVLVFSS